MRFVIEGRLPSLNDIINTARYNRYAGASQKKKETSRCAFEIIRQTRGKIVSPIDVVFTWIERDSRRDPDNVIAGQKFVFDGLVESGRLPNDTQQWVKSITHKFGLPDKLRPRVEVEITELK